LSASGYTTHPEADFEETSKWSLLGLKGHLDF